MEKNREFGKGIIGKVVVGIMENMTVSGGLLALRKMIEAQGNSRRNI